MGHRSGLRLRGLSAFLLLCALLSGCVSRIKAPLVRGPAATVAGPDPDLTFLKAGVTTRSEVRQQLGWLELPLNSDAAFFARWASSKVEERDTSYQGPSSLRAWKTTNLLVDFDERDLVTRHGLFPEVELPYELLAWSKRASLGPMHLSKTILLVVHHEHGGRKWYRRWRKDPPKHGRGSLNLGPEFARFVEDQGKHGFATTPGNLLRLAVDDFDMLYAYALVPDMTLVWCELQFRTSTPIGRKVEIWLSPEALLTLVRYLDQIQPSALQKKK